jgi:hypothetical protein
MDDADHPMYEEPEEFPHKIGGPAHDAACADLNWKEYNLLSLGNSNVYLRYSRHADTSDP